MKNYFSVMLGKQSSHAAQCFQEGFIGIDNDINQDLTLKLPEEWREFNKEFIPVFLAARPGKSKIAAGLACAAVWGVSKYIKKGDIVICPDGDDVYWVGEVTGDYYYNATGPLPHRRRVKWFEQKINRTDMSDALKRSTRSTGTVCDISRYNTEIEKFLAGSSSPAIIINDPTIEDASAFAMEKHLEDFLVENWTQTELGKEYDIFEVDGESVGQQYSTMEMGIIDILAISKNKKTFLVVELKRGRVSDTVVGQTLRYMGYVKEQLAEDGQTVKGAIIALEDDPRTRSALVMVPNIQFYKYQVSFKLQKISG